MFSSLGLLLLFWCRRDSDAVSSLAEGLCRAHGMWMMSKKRWPRLSWHAALMSLFAASWML